MSSMATNFSEEGSTDWLDSVIIQAIDGRASDIHFEPERDTLKIRLRIDGILHTIESVRTFSQESILSRIKVVSKMNISEHRFPQDGHFEFKYQEKIYNIRVSTFPTVYGETIALRIFNREDLLMKIDYLGLDQDQLEQVHKLITGPSGMVLITGPTGSGKTTLLYSVIHSLNSPDKNIITLEDPIEFQMANVRQLQINEGIGLTFAKAMRAVVRQDPDVIMLGEIRDADTAQMAMQAALIGILILCTFHTFDVPALINRLIEMGVAASVTAQTIKGVISTRLVRKICFSCREPHKLSDFEKRILKEEFLDLPFQKGKGCNTCRNTGYLGRMGIFEVVYFDNDLRSAIIEKRPASFIYELLHGKSIKNLQESAMEKVANGTTTLEEVMRLVDFPIVKS